MSVLNKMTKHFDLMGTQNSEASTPDALMWMRSTARPIMFRTGIEDAPISIWGTCFLAGYRRRLFAITAAHIIGNASVSQVVICAAEGSNSALTLVKGYRLEQPPDDDYEVDVHVYETTLQGIPQRDRDLGRIINLDRPEVTDWMGRMFTSLFFVCGHPVELNGVNYETKLVETSQVLLAGHYHEAGSAPAQHVLKVANPLNLEEFRGMSGSPVFSLEARLASEPLLRFCGIALMGGAERGIVRFLAATAILQTLDSVIQETAPGGAHISD